MTMYLQIIIGVLWLIVFGLTCVSLHYAGKCTRLLKELKKEQMRRRLYDE